MKILINLLLFCCGAVLAAEQCCEKGALIVKDSYCQNETQRINMSCPFGHMLLKDIIIDGNNIKVADAPSFVFVRDTKQYCLGQMQRDKNDLKLGHLPVAVLCFEGVTADNTFEVTGILTLVSVVFLLATFAVYSYLPQLRDLQGLCYQCLSISMALGFLTLGILQLSPGFKGEICTVTGFLVYFWMMATFFWMNVICINMYRTTIDASYLKKTEKKQYFWYSCYAWGGSLSFLIISLLANFVEGNHWKPEIGKGSCWFAGRTETWIFFYGPIAILLACNVIMFVMSSLNLWKHNRKYEVNKLNNLKHKFLLSFKLFFVMGISWIFEIISFAHGEYSIIWKITDTFNTLQGLIIFLLLVLLRRRVLQGLANENCCLFITKRLVDKLSPHDDSDDQQILTDDHVEVRLN